jgi:hypothetical protein
MGFSGDIIPDSATACRSRFDTARRPIPEANRAIAAQHPAFHTRRDSGKESRHALDG